VSSGCNFVSVNFKSNYFFNQKAEVIMKKNLLFMLIMNITFCCINSIAQTTVICPVTADTFIAESAPSSNFGSDPSFVIGKESWGDYFAPLVKFDLSSIPSNASITSSYLILTYAYIQETVNGRIYNILSSWNENTITWNTGVNIGNYSYDFTTGSGSTISIPVHSIVANWIENGAANWGFLLTPRTSSSNGNISAFYSREAYSGAYEPELEVTYTLPEPNLTYDANYCSLSVNGTVVDINVRVINNGQGDAGSSHLGYYLSEDNIITTDDWMIGDDYVNSLAPGEYDDEQINVDVTTVTPTIPPGTYKVGIIVDYLDEVIESNEDDNWGCWSSSQVVIPDPSYLTVSPTSKTVSSNSGNFQVTVSSNVNWAVSESCYWISCSPTSGSNNGTFTVSYQSNSSPNSRTCIITVSGGGESATVTVTQQGQSSYLTVSPTSKTVNSNSGNFQVTVSSNVNWAVSESCYWISCSPTSGSNNGTFTVSYQSNSSPNSRTCIITVSGGGESATVTVTQQGQSYYLTVAPPELVIGGYAGDSSQFSINSNISWTISDYPSWLDISTVSGQNDKIITVTASSTNETGSPKIAVLSISGSEVETKYVEVTQEDVTGINDNYLSKFIKIFPNPANDKIYIKTTVTGLFVKNLEILDLIGKSVYKSVLNNSNDLIRISLIDFQPGFYFIKLHTNKGVVLNKFIINR
jgi:hypothetical protein